jgi:hypothetical protein
MDYIWLDSDGFPPLWIVIVLRNQIKTSGLVPARFDLTTWKLLASSRDANPATPLVLI